MVQLVEGLKYSPWISFTLYVCHAKTTHHEALDQTALTDNESLHKLLIASLADWILSHIQEILLLIQSKAQLSSRLNTIPYSSYNWL